MAEGNQHRALVQRLEKFAILMQDKLPYLVVSLDLPGSNRQRPPRLEGFVPDLLVESVPRTMTVIGEAKSEKDLETGRSFDQLRGYFRYLRALERSALLISVPWPAAATARAVVKNARASVEDSEKVSFFILDGITSERDLVAELCH